MATIHIDDGGGADEDDPGPDADVGYMDADDDVAPCEVVTIVSGP